MKWRLAHALRAAAALAAVPGTARAAAAGTFAIVKVVDVVLGLRVDPEHEELGLDLTVHGELAYQS